jgi:hypothetical protein
VLLIGGEVDVLLKFLCGFLFFAFAEENFSPLHVQRGECWGENLCFLEVGFLIRACDKILVFSAAGEYLTKESLAAIKILKKETPNVRVRFVNILEISAIGIGNQLCQVPLYEFNEYFTEDKPVIFNFHGYPETLKQMLFDHQDGSGRFFVHGYTENGSTTTPFDLHLRVSSLPIACKRWVLPSPTPP